MSGIKWKTEFFDAYFEHGVEKCWECFHLRCFFFLKYGILEETVHGVYPPNEIIDQKGWYLNTIFSVEKQLPS